MALLPEKGRELFLISGNNHRKTCNKGFSYRNTCHMPGPDFVKLFTASSISRRMENGEPALLAGKSGIEIVVDVVLETTGKQLETEPQEHFGRSREYWIGWAVSYYQWFSARSYSDIFKVLSYEDLSNIYHTLHEADIKKICGHRR